MSELRYCECLVSFIYLFILSKDNK